MMLSAIYIPKNNLSHILGSHNGKILNLGGEFLYSVDEDDNSIILSGRVKNPLFISDFWGTDIDLVSAIVGRNGIGKTSILRAINHSIDPGHRNLLYIYETSDSTLIHIYNETGKQIINNSIVDYIKIIENRNFETLYYSPNLDYELKAGFSPIALINYIGDSLEEYYLDSIIRNVFLLNDPIIKDIKVVYPDFPSYDKYLIRVKNHTKSNFTKIYADANFANPNTGDVLRNELIGEIMRLEDPRRKVTMSKEELLNLLKGYVNQLERVSFNSLFRKVWELEEYNFTDDRDHIHSGRDFIKNFEVTVLSYLILGAVFPQTGLGGGLDFEEILSVQDFRGRLDKFLELYLINEFATLYEKIKKDLNGIEVAKHEQIVQIIKNDTWSKLAGVDIETVRKRMIADVEKFANILEFYDFIYSLVIDEKIVVVIEGNIEFKIQEGNISLFDDLINRYKRLLIHFRDIPTSVSILELIPNKKLSTGEKAIIDFFASVNDYVERNKISEHTNYENYLLLLDEAELGYHPIWKKKFVKAIVSVLPIIFSKITPKKYDQQQAKYVNGNIENPRLQIIFSTHDPLTLSDIPKQNIIYLNKNDENFSIVAEESFRSFAANVTDLLADSFFIEDGLLGDFARDKIDKTIQWLHEDEKGNYESHKKIIESIDEPIIRNKLAGMYSEKMKDTLAKDILKKEIDNLTDRYNKM